jgi:hypothetical protein
MPEAATPELRRRAAALRERAHLASCGRCRAVPKLEDRCLLGQLARVAHFVARERAGLAGPPPAGYW